MEWQACLTLVLLVLGLVLLLRCTLLSPKAGWDGCLEPCQQERQAVTSFTHRGHMQRPYVMFLTD